MTALLLDGNNLLIRATHAMARHPLTADGVPTGPLLVFVNGLARVVAEEAPQRLAVAWDGGHAARSARCADYKAARRPVPDQELRDTSFELAQRFLTLADVPQLRIPGLEADDLIAAWWRELTLEHADRVVIASNDHDFTQLLGPNPHGVPTDQIRWSSAHTPTDRWGAQRVQDELGYAPSCWPLLTALAGDPGDGVRGVPGVGPVKARRLLEAHRWDWPAVLDALGEHRAQAVLDLANVDLRGGGLLLPPPRRIALTCPGHPRFEALLNFLDTYQLASVKHRLLDNSLWFGADDEADPPGQPLCP